MIAAGKKNIGFDGEYKRKDAQDNIGPFGPEGRNQKKQDRQGGEDHKSSPRPAVRILSRIKSGEYFFNVRIPGPWLKGKQDKQKSTEDAEVRCVFQSGIN